MKLFVALSKFLKNIFSKNFTTLPEKNVIEKPEIDIINNPIPEDILLNNSTTTSTTFTTSYTTTSTTTKFIKTMVAINEQTLKHIEDWESRKYSMYDDGAGYGTIGIGHAIFDKEEIFNNKKLVTAKLTDKEIEELLLQDLKNRLKAEKQIKDKITIELTQNQFDALVLFIFNTGTLWNALATVINTYGKDINILKKQWRYYNTSRGKIMAGLINRREGELDLFLNQYKGRNYYNKSKTVDKKLIIGYY